VCRDQIKFWGYFTWCWLRKYQIQLIKPKNVIGLKRMAVFRAADCKWADRLIDQWVTICDDTTICTTRPLKTQSIKALDCTIKYGDQGESKQI